MPRKCQSRAKQAVALILAAMAGTLARGERIELRGFGSFEIVYRRPRMGRNPKTGQRLQIAGKSVLHFKAGRELRGRVWPGGNTLAT